MLNTQLLIVMIVRALVEVAGFALLGQGILYVLAGASREQNIIYKFFQILTRPVVRVVRWITPRVIIDRHVPMVSFFLIFWIWIFLNVLKRTLCEGAGVVCV